MTIEQAIEKAIEGGYKHPNVSNGIDISPSNLNLTLLNPLFWQALGKSMGWKYMAYRQGRWNRYELDQQMMSDTAFSQEEWLYYWHYFIDYLAEGKSIESFFETLS